MRSYSSKLQSRRRLPALMYEITAPSGSPYATICYIECQWPDGTAIRASGVVVGYNDVLTALHVVFEAEMVSLAA